MQTIQQLKWRKLAKQGKSILPKFRKDSKTEKLAFMIIEKGINGYLTYEQIAQELYGKKYQNMNFEEKFIVWATIRGLMRDIRYKFNIFIERIFIPKIEGFAYKVIQSEKEFDEVIERILVRIENLKSHKSELLENRGNPKYREQVRIFFDEVFK